MKTKYPVLLAAAMAVAGMMLSMSGFTGAMQSEDRFSSQGASNLEQAQANNPVDNGSTGAGTGAGGVFGYIVTAAPQLFNFIMMVVFLPVQLREMGFPAFFAYPLGLAAQTIAGIGIIQFIGARVYR